jgi:hypothetical protein
MATFILFECAAGYALFELVGFDKVGAKEVQSSVTDLGRFSKYVKLTAFQPFESAEDALANINSISEGILDESLLNFLKFNLPKVSKNGKPPTAFTLGVVAPNLVQSIKNETNIQCLSDETVREVTRGIRLHLAHFIAALGGDMMRQSQLGLSHSYSRAKVKFNIHRSDNMIIQAIALIDQMDKDLNTFAMRVREWYSWHFPELLDYVSNNFQCVVGAGAFAVVVAEFVVVVAGVVGVVVVVAVVVVAVACNHLVVAAGAVVVVVDGKLRRCSSARRHPRRRCRRRRRSSGGWVGGWFGDDARLLLCSGVFVCLSLGTPRSCV